MLKLYTEEHQTLVLLSSEYIYWLFARYISKTFRIVVFEKKLSILLEYTLTFYLRFFINKVIYIIYKINV